MPGVIYSKFRLTFIIAFDREKGFVNIREHLEKESGLILKVMQKDRIIKSKSKENLIN